MPISHYFVVWISSIVNNVVTLQPIMGYSFNKYKQQYTSLIKLGAPILLGQLGIIATSFFDTLMVGHYSTEALASASFVNGLFNLITFMSMGFSYGLTPIIATAFGRGDNSGIGDSLKNGIVLNLVFAAAVVAIMSVAYIFVEDMGQPDELMPIIKPYYRTVLLSMIPMVLINAIKQFSDGITDTRLGMWIIIGGNVLNIVGNYILIFGKLGFPEYGLLGAGISTLFSRIVMVAVYAAIICTSRKYRPFIEAFTDSRINNASMRRIFATSMPISLQMGFETGSFTAASVMIGWLGKDQLAAYQVMLVIGTLGFMVYYSVGASIAIKMANYHGEGSKTKMRQCSVAGYHIMLMCAAFACSVFYLFSEPLIRIFTDDNAVVAIALTLIVPMILYQLGDATQITYANALRGLSDAKPMMYIAGFAYVVVGLPACYLLAFPLGLGIVGAYLSFTVSLVTAGSMFMYRFYSHPAVRLK